jgi:hypothetical protein
MNRQITVCKGCEERFIGCHAVCERFKEQSRQQDELKERYMKSIELDGDYARQVLKGKERKRRSEKR